MFQVQVYELPISSYTAEEQPQYIAAEKVAYTPDEAPKYVEKQPPPTPSLPSSPPRVPPSSSNPGRREIIRSFLAGALAEKGAERILDELEKFVGEYLQKQGSSLEEVQAEAFGLLLQISSLVRLGK